MQHVVQRQVTSALSSSATELTRNNTALAGMVAQLEMLAGDAALQEAHGEGGGACAPPCLDLRQYPVLHSQACICAAQAFSRMRVLSEQAAVLSTWAIMGDMILHDSAAPAVAPAESMDSLCGTITTHACRMGPPAGLLHIQSGRVLALAGWDGQLQQVPGS